MGPEKLTNRDVEFIDRRMNEFDRRQDVHIKEKIEALEKLLNLTITTKADALVVLISRLQTDSKECAVKCSKQVSFFSGAISGIHKQLDGYKIDNIKSLLDSVVLEKEELEKKVEELEKWKSGFWVKNASTAIVSAVALINIALYGFTWFVDYLSKIIGMKSGPPGP